MQLNVRDLSYSYSEENTIDEVCLDVQDGEFVGLIGPNGSGKSTILKNVYRSLTPDNGCIMLDGEELAKMSFRQSALRQAVVGQENEVPFDFLVEEIVAMGRSPHKKLFDADSAEDKKIVGDALSYLGMSNMARRSYQNISGGEKQRVLIARAIAQQTELMILDEPTNHLDISYQLQIFDLVKQLGVTVFSAIHDLNLAAMYCDRIIALKNGRVVTSGTPEEVLTAQTIHDIFGVEAEVAVQPRTGKLAITYIPSKYCFAGSLAQ